MNKQLAKSRFYYVLYSMLESGVPMTGALRGPFESNEYKKAARFLYNRISNGTTLSEAMKEISLFSEMEIALVKVGEKTGSLTDIFRTISRENEDSYKRKRTIQSKLVYPMFVYFVSGPLLTIIKIFAKHTPINQALTFLCVWTLAPFIIYYLLKFLLPLLHKIPFFTNIIENIPLLGRIQFLMECSRFFSMLSISLYSGMPIIESIDFAARCCKTAPYRRRYASMKDMIYHDGCHFAVAFNVIMTSREENSPIPTLINTGETSGSLAQSCEHIATILTEELTAKLERLSVIIPLIVYCGIMFYIAVQIIGFFASIFTEINSLIQ